MIARQGTGARETFTVRKQSFGVGVERTFPVHSPKIEQLEVVARGDVRRAKLYYLRGRVGKRARVAERRWGIEDDLVIDASPRRAEAVDSEGVAPGARPSRAPTPRTPRRAKPRPRRSDGGRGRPAEARSGRAERRARGSAEGAEAEAAESEDSESPRRQAEDSDGTARLIPKPTSGARRDRRAGRDRRARDRAGAGDPGLRVKPYQIPSGVDGADARRRPAGARQPGQLPLRRPRDRRHRRLPPAVGRRRPGEPVRRPSQPPRARPCPEPTPEEAGHQLHQADRRRPRRHADDQRRAPVVNGESRPRSDFIKPVPGRRRLQSSRSRSRSRPTTTS